MKTLILIRHGQSEWNKMNLFTGWTDVDLTHNGIAEAYEAGRVLKERGFHPAVCFTSYLKRAVKTLNEVLDAMDMDYLPVYKTWRLNEKSYGALQGCNKADMVDKYGKDQVQLWRRSFDVRPPAIPADDARNPRKDPRYDAISDAELPSTEALCDTVDRLMPYYNDTILPALREHEQVMVVAHGNSLRGIIKELKGYTNEEIISENIPTAVPYIFEFSDDLKVQKSYYVGDPETIKRKIEDVANQTKKK